MKHWKMAIISLVVLALLAVPLLSCGEEEEGEITIRVGYLTDLTGVASSAMGPNQWAILDCWEYLEKTDPIPGAKLKLISYDTGFNPGRFIPGYDWLKDQGVVVMYSYMPQVTDTIVSFLERDKMPVFSHTLTAVSALSPWVFNSGMSVADQYNLSLKWLSDHWPNYPTKPKIGVVGWDTSYERDIVGAMKPYCLAHPDEFEWVGSYLAPAGVMTWSGEVRALKGCDYVCPCSGGGAGYSTFMSQFRAAGGTATFFGGEGTPCWTNLIVPTVGWEDMDGSFNAITWPWYTGPSPNLIAAGKDAVARRGETEISLGYGYFSQFVAQVFWYELLKATAEEVGAENVDSQAVYNAAIKFRYTIEGMKEMGYSETNRMNTHWGMVYEWSAEAQDLVPISEWLLAPD